MYQGGLQRLARPRNDTRSGISTRYYYYSSAGGPPGHRFHTHKSAAVLYNIYCGGSVVGSFLLHTRAHILYRPCFQRSIAGRLFVARNDANGITRLYISTAFRKPIAFSRGVPADALPRVPSVLPVNTFSVNSRTPGCGVFLL